MNYDADQLVIKIESAVYDQLILREVLYKDELDHLPLQLVGNYDTTKNGFVFSVNAQPEFFEMYREYNLIGVRHNRRELVTVPEETASDSLSGISAGIKLVGQRENGGLQHYSKRGAWKITVLPDEVALGQFSRFENQTMVVIRKPANWSKDWQVVARVLLDRDSQAAYDKPLTLAVQRETPTHLVVHLQSVFDKTIVYRETNYIEILVQANGVLVPLRSDKRKNQAHENMRYTTLVNEKRLIVATKPIKSHYPIVAKINQVEDQLHIQLEGTFSETDRIIAQPSGRSLYQNALAGQGVQQLPFKNGMISVTPELLASNDRSKRFDLLIQNQETQQSMSILMKRLEAYDKLGGQFAKGTWRIQKRANRLQLVVNMAPQKSAPVKLAVLGSCYSRRGLASSEYFSPEYKSYFQVVQTQFHTSLPSIMAKPSQRGLTLMQNLNLNPKHRHWIETDLQKDFFAQLQATQPEYFVFDLYADSHVGMIDWGNGELSMAYYFYKQQLKSVFYDLQDVQIISHTHVENYMAMWEKAAQAFFERLITIMPESHIILQKAHRTYSYWDREHKEVKIDELFYGQAESEGRRGDYFAERMEQWIVDHYPNIHVIDLDSYNLRGQYNHPDGPTTNHYEPAWYKAYVAELGKTIMLQERVDRLVD